MILGYTEGEYKVILGIQSKLIMGYAEGEYKDYTGVYRERVYRERIQI